MNVKLKMNLEKYNFLKNEKQTGTVYHIGADGRRRPRNYGLF